MWKSHHDHNHHGHHNHHHNHHNHEYDRPRWDDDACKPVQDPCPPRYEDPCPPRYDDDCQPHWDPKPQYDECHRWQPEHHHGHGHEVHCW